MKYLLTVEGQRYHDRPECLIAARLEGLDLRLAYRCDSRAWANTHPEKCDICDEPIIYEAPNEPR